MRAPICVVLLSSVTILAKAQTIQKSSDHPYEWPKKAGTLEWKTLPSLEARVAASEIPKETARSLTTRALVRTCMSHPLRAVVAFRNNPSDGINFLFQNFYGLKELILRDDAAAALLDYYEGYSRNLETAEEIWFEDLFFTNFLLQDSRILDKFEPDQIQELLDFAIANYRNARGRADTNLASIEDPYIGLISTLIVKRNVQIPRLEGGPDVAILQSDMRAYLGREPTSEAFLDSFSSFVDAAVVAYQNK